MPLSNAQRQARYRLKVRTGQLARIEVTIPFEIAHKLGYLAHHWQCTRAEAVSRMLLEAWDREGNPIPGYDAHGEPLPGNEGPDTGRTNPPPTPPGKQASALPPEQPAGQGEHPARTYPTGQDQEAAQEAS